MAKETEIIKQEIEIFKTNNGGDYEDYYIGITNNIDRRIVESNETIIEHLNKGEYTTGNPIYTEECTNRNEAVKIERFFQELGMLKYNPRSFGLEESRFIYCYKMTDENKKMVLSGNSTSAKEMITSMKKFKDFKNGK